MGGTLLSGVYMLNNITPRQKVLFTLSGTHIVALLIVVCYKLSYPRNYVQMHYYTHYWSMCRDYMYMVTCHYSLLTFNPGKELMQVLSHVS